MNQSSLSPHPKAMADYLRHRFDILLGAGFRAALGEPGTKDRHQALIEWSSKALTRHQSLGLVARIEHIESDLWRCLAETGLLGNPRDCSPIPVAVISKLWEPPRLSGGESGPQPCSRKSTESKNASTAQIQKADTHEPA